MDEYTFRTMNWLNRRYRKTNAEGVYFAHQPIYGFHDTNSEPNVIERYNRVFQVLKRVSHLDAHSLVDIGASEGFIANLMRNQLGWEVECVDLSEEACKRVESIFHIKAQQADARQLPFSDGQFDVAICTETLEHIVDFPTAVDELLRVARKAVVITVPHDNPEIVEKNQELDEPHAHINAFDRDQFEYLTASGYQVISHPFQSRYLFYPGLFIEKFRTRTKNPLFSRLLKAIAGLLLVLDGWISERTGDWYTILFIIIKDPAVYKETPSRKIRVGDILNQNVGYLYLR